MSRVKSFLQLLFLFAISPALIAQESQLSEYKYDKDKYDIQFAVMSNNPGHQAGMHFNVGKTPQIVQKIAVFVSGGKLDGIKANLHLVLLRDDNKNTDLVFPFAPYALGTWNVLDLSAQQIEISENVIVGIEWVTPTGESDPYSSFFIGADINVSNHNGYIKYPGGDWFPARRFGTNGPKNLYIRLYTTSK